MNDQINIFVKLLAIYRKMLPEGTIGNTCKIGVPVGADVSDVMALFDLDYDMSNVVLVNGKTPIKKQILEEHDTVCVFPAIAGG